jgi:nitroreductase
MTNLHDLLIHRRSYRKYTGQPLDPDDVKTILEAALMAPAGKRRNPWRFIVVEDKDTLTALSTAKDGGAGPLAGAALAIALVANPEESDTWVEDLSIAATLIQLQCADLGLGSCWIHMRGRFDENGVSAEANVRRILDIPEAYEVLCVISIGHPDEERKPYDTEKLQWEKVHIGQFKAETPID